MVGNIGVLGGEDTMYVVVVGFEKATISVHCYLTVSN